MNFNRNRFVLLFALLTWMGYSCSSKNGDSEISDSLAVDSVSAHTSASNSPSVSDTSSAQKYDKNASDPLTVSKIARVLPTVLKKQLEGTDSSARRFTCYQTDLNDDGKDEYFVGLTGMNWCGSGGCTALLLDNNGKLISYFTVIDFPIYILNDKNNGWKNLVAYSNGSNRLLKWDKNEYPGNPSVEPKFKGELNKDIKMALGSETSPAPKFDF